MDESRVRESETAEWHRLQGDALRPGSGAETRRRDQGDGGTGLKSLEADVALVVLCPWQDTDFHRTIRDRTDTSQIFSDLLRFKYPNDNIVMVAGQYREAP